MRRMSLLVSVGGGWVMTAVCLIELLLVACKVDGRLLVPWALVLVPLWIVYGTVVLAFVAALDMAIASCKICSAPWVLQKVFELVPTGGTMASLVMLAAWLDGHLRLTLLEVLVPMIAASALMLVLIPLLACTPLGPWIAGTPTVNARMLGAAAAI